ncbi:hypothetical protein [Prosthecobacter sp.]|uniref:hypothetical protein n=1 Tax=Prosthecobacter sp. TaxID=1965333 RepID=UPI003783683E
MKIQSSDAWQFVEPREALDLQKLQDCVRADARALGPWLTQMNNNQAIRDCIWPGQSPDGRKRSSTLGREADPYEGASDAQVFAVDEAINETKDVMMAAQRAGRLEVQGRNANQDEGAALITPVVQYVLGTQMAADVVPQSKLWADFMLDHGHGFLYVGWLTARELEERTVSVEDLLGLALGMTNDGTPAPAPASPEMAAQADTELWDLILDPERREQLIGLLMGYDPEMTKAEAGRVATQLKRNEAATYFAPYVRESRPTWEALCLGADLTITPAAMMDLQKAPRVTRWHWWTEAQLYDLAQMQGWDAAALEKVAASPGPMWSEWSMADMPSWIGGTLGVGASFSIQDVREARLYHVAETWERRPTKAGPSVLTRTIHHAASPDKPLHHGLVKDRHGRIPIIPLQREVKSKLLLGSRGMSQVGQGFQNSLKLHFDALDDNTDLRMRPPINVPQGRFKVEQGKAAAPLPIGPWKQMPFPRGEKENLSFMDGLPDPAPSIEIQKALRTNMRRYFGLVDAEVPPTVTQTRQQEMATLFMAGLAEAIDLTVQLCQQYMDPIVEAEVAGMAVPLNATREQIQGRFKFKLSYDVKELDMDFLTKKFKMLSEMLQFDTGGAVPRGELMSYVFGAADPVLSQRLKIDTSGGANDAMNDEKSVIAEQVAGHRITDRYNSPGARLQAHWEWVRNPQVMQMLAANQTLLMLEVGRAEQLEMQLEQQTQNKVTGRTGAPSEAPWEEGGKYSDWLKMTFGLKGASQAGGNVVPMSQAA